MANGFSGRFYANLVAQCWPGVVQFRQVNMMNEIDFRPSPPSASVPNRRRMFLILAVGLLALILAALVFLTRSKSGSTPPPVSTAIAPEVAALAPDFELRTLTGETVRLRDLRGRPVILNFWATWCPPCRREMPALEVVWQQYNRGDVMVLGVDQGESPAVVEEFIRTAAGVSFPLLLDIDQSVGDAYLVHSMPTTFFIDAEGRIRDIRVGGPMKLEFLNEQVRRLQSH